MTKKRSVTSNNAGNSTNIKLKNIVNQSNSILSVKTLLFYFFLFYYIYFKIRILITDHSWGQILLN